MPEQKIRAGEVPITLTGYWPWEARTATDRKREGGTHDRKGWPLHALEDYLEGRAPFVSLSADPALFDYGQAVVLDVPGLPAGVRGRIVDTGENFQEPGKKYRHPGHQPVDLCVRRRARWNKAAVGRMVLVPGDVLDPRTGHPPTQPPNT